LEQQDLELRVQLEFKEQQDQLALLVQELQVQQESKVALVLRALLDCKVLLERQELLVDKDQQGQLAWLVILELLEQLVSDQLELLELV
jgi:hypothetical protein